MGSFCGEFICIWITWSFLALVSFEKPHVTPQSRSWVKKTGSRPTVQPHVTFSTEKKSGRWGICGQFHRTCVLWILIEILIPGCAKTWHRPECGQNVVGPKKQQSPALFRGLFFLWLVMDPGGKLGPDQGVANMWSGPKNN